MGQLDQARLGLDGPRESALLVAEQLGLQQLLGQRRAVDGDVVRRRDLPDYVLARENLRSAASGGAPVAADPRLTSTEGLSLAEARERWLTVLEGTYLRDILDRHDGNISAAAKAAGIDRKTFHRLVTKHQIR